MNKNLLISTGGSGGHVIPATIFYEHLKNDFKVCISSDERGTQFLDTKRYNVKIINTPQISNNFFLLPFKFFLIIYLIFKSFFFLKKKNINVLISTGGYMSLPICIASKILNIKIYLFEPNMVLGRANKLFIRFCEKIFCYSNKIKNLPNKFNNKIVLINTMIRKEFYSIKSNEEINKVVNLLIIGGSQGAKLFDTKVKNSVIELSKEYKLKVFQQTNFKNYENLRTFYNNNNIENELFDYRDNIVEFMSQSNICITRAGASTLAELIFLNIPYLTIPLPLSKDDHQFQNALFYKNMNCCWIIKQDELNDDVLLDNLRNIIRDKEDYLIKKNNMKKFSYQNTWNNINQKLINTINEN
tara:strand:- start:5773 stop:6843 length:1071 start_codon:yes stop_codon:yes gene_type:complete